MANVMNSIGHEEVTSHVTGTGRPVKDLVITDAACVSRATARAKIMELASDVEPEFWAWQGAYDHVGLATLFGRMIDLPHTFPMMTKDIKQLWVEKGRPAMPRQPSGAHNALADAKFNAVRYSYLRAYGANEILDRYQDSVTGEWLWPDPEYRPPSSLLPESHQVWVWMNGPIYGHWEPRGTGAVL